LYLKIFPYYLFHFSSRGLENLSFTFLFSFVRISRRTGKEEKPIQERARGIQEKQFEAIVER